MRSVIVNEGRKKWKSEERNLLSDWRVDEVVVRTEHNVSSLSQLPHSKVRTRLQHHQIQLYENVDDKNVFYYTPLQSQVPSNTNYHLTADVYLLAKLKWLEHSTHSIEICMTPLPTMLTETYLLMPWPWPLNFWPLSQDAIMTKVWWKSINAY